MRRHALLALALGLLLAADAPTQDATKKDRDKLQGTWRVVSVDDGDKKAPADFWKRFSYTFQGDTVRFLGDNTTPGADLTFTYTLDAAKKPKAIDLKIIKSGDKKDIGKTQLGIYRLDGDSLTICAGDRRPTEFAANAKLHTAVVVLKREKK